MLIHNKDDIKFVTEFPCFLGHPVYYMKRWKNTFVLPIFCITKPEYMYATFLHQIVMESVFEWNPVCKAYIIWWKGWPGRSLLRIFRTPCLKDLYIKEAQLNFYLIIIFIKGTKGTELEGTVQLQVTWTYFYICKRTYFYICKPLKIYFTMIAFSSKLP